MNTVKIDAQQVKDDARRMGTTLEKIGLSMGKSRNYIYTTISADSVRVETANAIERAMFKDPGTYCLPVEKEEQKPAQGAVTEKHLDDFAKMASLMNSLLIELREYRAETQELLKKIADKEIGTNAYTARMYEHVRMISEELRA